MWVLNITPISPFYNINNVKVLVNIKDDKI